MKLKRTLLGPLMVALVALVSGGWLLQRGVASEGGAFQQARILEEVLSRISRDYVDQRPSEELYRMAVEGLLRELGDPYTSFMSAEEYNNLRVQTTGEYGGLGIQIAERDGWITVIAPLPGTPAERVGLLAGDRIVEVEGRSTEGWKDEEAVRVLRGPKGTAVNIKIVRAGVSEPSLLDHARGDPRQLGAVRLHGRGRDRSGPADALQRDLDERAADGDQRAPRAGDAGPDPGPAHQPRRPARPGRLDLRPLPRPGQAIVETRARNPRDSETYSAAQPEVFLRAAGDRAGRRVLRQRVGDRGRRAAGPRPRAGARHHDLRQGLGADALPALGRQLPEDDDREVVHALGPLHPEGARRPPMPRRCSRRSRSGSTGSRSRAPRPTP
jgi:carboxyl-terminal processing protease